ncbi:P-loop containing nucleoside triphosphate hydrolase protein [Xylaria bambusicola]|uniref:P-loop containing nucleoside triphosphate hydrolase protein n=1 Tax=Xylaria bambusicola TaxID=326684 RepID=UPI002007C8D9|nr:P-loop containing nucleoside triphosphate hydrolase protein [Xylaria bambusicola]KAI0521579.1 P-loop containing nucleoside triphosphate hydrolase protein [Xylaria bambusicola]
MSGWDNNDGMRAALADVSNGTQPANGAIVHRDAPSGNWGEKTQNDYKEGNENVTWESNMRVYEWDGEEGDVGPEYPELEFTLFGDPETRDPQGIDFNVIDRINVIQEGIARIQPINSFKDAGLHPIMLRNVELAGYRTPTPIQRYCIPAIRMGYDLLAIAQTGSGKTAAYLVPIINHLMGKAKKIAAPRPHPDDAAAGTRTRAEPLLVVVAPARELAIQIFAEACKFCYRTMLRPCTIYGGGPLRDQIANLQRGCDVLVASPGRLIDLMERGDVLSLRRVKYMVIDEADELLQADWEDEFNKILGGGEQEEGNVKYMLFSATFPTAVRQLAKTHLAETYVRIKVGRVGSTHENIKQDVVYVESSVKKQALLDLLYTLKPARTIIFVNSKRMADELDDFLFNKDLPCTSMHSDRTQREREDAMRAFRSGKTPLFITTGVTARGIDVRNVMHVINFDLPSMEHGGIQEYIHRIGRTGRIGHHGLATSFYSERDEPIAPLLTMTLMETNQAIPDFLQQYKPEGDNASKLKFEYDTDEEDPGEGGEGWAAGGGDTGDAGGDGWGAGGDSATPNGNNGGGNTDGWGASTNGNGGNAGGNANGASDW